MTGGTYQVFWTQTAARDLKKIVDYIGEDSRAEAEKVYQTIKEKGKNLRQMPLKGRVVPELQYYGVINYRELIITPWRVIYKIEQDRVWVLAVIDERRNVEDLLLDRLL